MSDQMPPIDDLIPDPKDFVYLDPYSEPTSQWMEAQATVTLIDISIQEDFPDYNPPN